MNPTFIPETGQVEKTMITVRIYGTVYNNAKIARDSVESILRLNFHKKIYIVDNFSNDGTYEQLLEFKEIRLIRKNCSRGLGKQLAMEMACEEASQGDLVMTFDLDTIYKPGMEKIVNWAIDNLKPETVLPSFLCYYTDSCRIPWKNLNNGEDWERIAHFASLGFKCLQFTNVDFCSNQVVNKNRELRYSRGIKFYFRLLKNAVDVIRGWGIDSPKKLLEYLKFVKMRTKTRKWLTIIVPFTLIFLYCKLFKEIYTYGEHINRLYPNFIEMAL